MAQYDISAATSTTVTSKGQITNYSFHVFDQDGSPKQYYSTTNKRKAQAFLKNSKTQYGNPTINGKSGTDPFQDGTFGKQADFEFGGFGIEDEETLMSRPVTAKDMRQINATPGTTVSSTSGPARQRKKRKHFGGTKLTKSKVNVDFIRSARFEGEFGKPWEEIPKKIKDEIGKRGTKRFQAMVNRCDPVANGWGHGPSPPVKTESEVIVGRGIDNNAFIIIGNDRIDYKHTGYGGHGHTQCDAIDIVAGAMGHEPKEVEKNKDGIEEEKVANPSFAVDAARIYISQKTDVDKNFGIGEFGRAERGNEEANGPQNIGKYGAKSAIAIKADNIRVIGRESLRLVTGTDDMNSQGGKILGKSGIELVANNKIETLQPIVLGNNLQIALVTILDNIEAIANIFQAYIKYQMKFNQAVSKHTHITPFFGLPALPSEVAIIGGIVCDIETASKTELSVFKHVTNLQGVKTNFLTPSGPTYINSRSNKVN